MNIKSEYILLVVAIAAYIIFSRVVNYQKYKLIASHTTEKEFNFYINLRNMSSILAFIVIIIYSIPMIKQAYNKS